MWWRPWTRRAGDSALVVAVGECATGWTSPGWATAGVDLAEWTLEQVTTTTRWRKGLPSAGLGRTAAQRGAHPHLQPALRLVPDGAVTLGPGPLLLTSDGVHKSLGRSEIEAVLSHDPTDPWSAAGRGPVAGSGTMRRCY